MKELIAKLMRRPGVAHLLAANERFGKRLGSQFAGAVTYFSVLSMIPVLMFAIAALGLTFTVLRPDLLPQVQSVIQEQFGDPNGKIGGFVADTFKSWPTTGAFAFLAAAYSGSNWVKNLKFAVRAMWRDKFSEAAKTGNFFLEILGNLVTFFGLLLSLGVAVAVTSAGQAFPKEIINWLGIGGVPGVNILLQLVSVVVSLVASWLLFAFLFTVLPGERASRGTWLKATIAGAVLVTVLQQVASILVRLLSQNRSASVFGPIIILMIVFNVLATIILMIAAWVGTAETWESERVKKEADKAAGVAERDELGIEDNGPDGDALAGVSPAPFAARHRAERWAANIDSDDLRAVNYDPDRVVIEDPDATVSQDVAAKGVRVGMGVGYGVGAATGIGMGALIAALISKIANR